MISRGQDAIAIDADIELEEAPGDEPGLRNRVMTPERLAAVRRPYEYDRDVGKSRRRIMTTVTQLLTTTVLLLALWLRTRTPIK